MGGFEGAVRSFLCAACGGFPHFAKLRGCERRCSPLLGVACILPARRSVASVVGAACQVVRMRVAPCRGESTSSELRLGPGVPSICATICCLSPAVGHVLCCSGIAILLALCPLWAEASGAGFGSAVGSLGRSFPSRPGPRTRSPLSWFAPPPRAALGFTFVRASCGAALCRRCKYPGFGDERKRGALSSKSLKRRRAAVFATVDFSASPRCCLFERSVQCARWRACMASRLGRQQHRAAPQRRNTGLRGPGGNAREG